MAQLFQDGVDRMQQWFISMEQELAELRNAERVMLHLSEATERAKVKYFYFKSISQKHNNLLTYLLNLYFRLLLKRFKSNLLIWEKYRNQDMI